MKKKALFELEQMNDDTEALFGEVLSPKCKEQVAAGVQHIIDAVNQYVDHEGTKDTPVRVARMYDELLAGYVTDPVRMLNNALFTVEYDEMVVVKDIEYYSLCEHHLIPFFGRAHVGYLPDGKVVGLSKIPRLVDIFAR
ncbi:MAG: GTP cyclohydrolase I, partial [Chloroflexi bacterium]|nr:GTP cyclohydrolase I [Chloroflexota bacterium]